MNKCFVGGESHVLHVFPFYHVLCHVTIFLTILTNIVGPSTRIIDIKNRLSTRHHLGDIIADHLIFMTSERPRYTPTYLCNHDDCRCPVTVIGVGRQAT